MTIKDIAHKTNSTGGPINARKSSNVQAPGGPRREPVPAAGAADEPVVLPVVVQVHAPYDGAAYGVAYGAVWTGGVAAGTATAATGLLLLGPALAVGGILRGVNNSQVDNEIKSRRTLLPFEVPPEAEQQVNVFFPLAPEPARVILVYVDSEGAHELTIDTQPALAGLHLANDD